jgi:TolB-like protein/class 3 adenylate cyclase/Tfp pilus assembly protein PilF
MASTRRLAADVAGYSRLMGADEEGTHERVQAHLRELVDPKITEHRGRIVKNTGDGVLAEFASVVDAVRCAVEVQRGMVDREPEVPDERRIRFRIGVNLGDIIVEQHDIFGDGVNVAARLETLAEPGGICISRTVRDQIRDKLPYSLQDMGEQSVKNIARPVRTYALSADIVAALPRVAVPIRPKTARHRAKPRRETPRLSIVVLPFTNLSNDPDQEYFADGITDDLTTDLSRIADSFVIARNTAFTYKGKSVDAKEIGRELGVRYVLEGSVRRTGEQVRVNVQLIDTKSGAHIWADRFDTDRADLAEAQNEITGRLARTPNIELVRDAGRRIDQGKAVDPDARDFVMRGWAYWYRPISKANRQEVQRAFARALEIDSRSIDARIGLAMVLVSVVLDGLSSSPEQDKARAEQLLLEALEADTNNALAHVALAMLRRAQNRLSEAQMECEVAIALNGNDALAFFQLGQTLMWLGQPEAGIPHIEKANRLNPRDPNMAIRYWGLGTCHLILGHVSEALDLFNKGRAENPRLFYMHLFLAGALSLHGDLDEARASLAESLRLKPEIDSLARLYALNRGNTNPHYWALAERTLHIGLRQAGFPDE